MIDKPSESVMLPGRERYGVGLERWQAGCGEDWSGDKAYSYLFSIAGKEQGVVDKRYVKKVGWIRDTATYLQKDKTSS